jgi:hypothetical protein
MFTCVLEVRHSHFIEVTEHLLSCLETTVELIVDSSELQVLGMFAKLRKVTVSFIICLSPYGTTRLTLDIFSQNIFYTFL